MKTHRDKFMFLAFVGVSGIILSCGVDSRTDFIVIKTEKQYPLKLQPELDIIDISQYLVNPRLLNLQMKCLLYNGPCDIVGKWMKPRVKAGLLGECQMCTQVQRGWLEKWLNILIDTRPDLYRAGIAKYLQNTGIVVPEAELLNVQRTLEAVDKLSESSSNNTSTFTTVPKR